MKKALILIQARMSSTRLPKKVMLPVCGKPLLYQMYERVIRSQYAGQVVIITSNRKEDDPIESFCVHEGILFYRGHPTDLLDRHYKAAKKFRAKHVVKIPSDCPLIDPRIIDKVIGAYLDGAEQYDYVSNLHPASYPDGNDVEIMNFEALEKAWICANKNYEREHTTPFIWENPNLFKIGNVTWFPNLDYSLSHRWTLDYEEDYLLIRAIYQELYPHKPNFRMDDILELLERKPHLKKINAIHLGKSWYTNHLNELNSINDYKTKYVQILNG
ncbi:MAG: glycosyltransferase family protein [Ignavibacteriaceae bacterium]|nr:glycosyltransferase family protein [Ignavibacteriaceae bacterium]